MIWVTTYQKLIQYNERTQLTAPFVLDIIIFYIRNWNILFCSNYPITKNYSSSCVILLKERIYICLNSPMYFYLLVFANCFFLFSDLLYAFWWRFCPAIFTTVWDRYTNIYADCGRNFYILLYIGYYILVFDILWHQNQVC